LLTGITLKAAGAAAPLSKFSMANNLGEHKLGLGFLRFRMMQCERGLEN
jgi:hypothetical protein